MPSQGGVQSHEEVDLAAKFGELALGDVSGMEIWEQDVALDLCRTIAQDDDLVPELQGLVDIMSHEEERGVEHRVDVDHLLPHLDPGDHLCGHNNELGRSQGDAQPY